MKRHRKFRFQTDKNGENTKIVNAKSEGLICQANTEENAVFVCRVLNAYDELVEALENITKNVGFLKLNIRKDFSLINANACALKVLYLLKGGD